jgi:hypothetical protein
MNLLTRILAALALAIGLALPAVGGEGGETGGGTGVWVLPASRFLCVDPPGAPRESRSFGITQDIVMQVSSQGGVSTATFVDDLTALPVSLPMTGSLVRIPSSLLQSLSESSSPSGTIMIVDAQLLGLLMRLTISTQGLVTIEVY